MSSRSKNRLSTRKLILLGGGTFSFFVFLAVTLFLCIQIFFPERPNRKSDVYSVISTDESKWNVTELEQNFHGVHTKGKVVTPSVKSNCAALLIHGYKSNHVHILKYAPIFLELGCSIYAFDLPAHGEAEGDILTWGKHELPFLKEGLDLIKKRETSNARIGIFGESLGGALAIQLAGEPDVKYVISDSSYSRIKDIFLFQGIKRYGELTRWFLEPAMFVASRAVGVDFSKYSPVSHVDKVKIPLLVIHSETDEFTPFSHYTELKKTSENNPNVKFIATTWGALHGKSFETNKKEYASFVTSFIRSSFSQVRTSVDTSSQVIR